MAISYPSNFKLPRVEGVSSSVMAGLAKTESSVHQDQRRVFLTMPHTFQLTFIMTFQEWGIWQAWVRSYAYRWFNINLPTMYAGLSVSSISPVLIRFISDISTVTLSQSVVQITVSAESAPSMTANYLGAV
jgi:hypothetical protein